MAIKTLYVGNLPYSATEDELLQYFTSYGAKNPRIIEGRGFAFVDIDEDQLETAIAEKHESEMNGRRLTVNEARPRGEGGGRSFSGGGGRYRESGGYGGGGGGGDYGGGGGRDSDRGRGGRGGGRRGY